AGGSVNVQTGTTIQKSNAVGGWGGGANLVGGNGGNGYGAGIYSSGTTLIVQGAVIQNCRAVGGPAGNHGGSGYGGGLYVASGWVPMPSSSLLSNSAISESTVGVYGSKYGGSAYGGAVYVAGGSVTLSNDTVQSNSATGGTTTTGRNGGNAYGGGI